ncbi:MAG TPA: hypothetical protein VM582_01835, partial [Candidatus Thermoplasmatota archaeon]|nr:hypothetical protein [Candidatus Thermoplasmatota archaeon]
QYLVPPEQGEGEDGPLATLDDASRARYPCTGAVLAVNDGPSDVFPEDADGRYHHGTGSTYVESYLIRDVHDRTWIVDKWLLENGRPLWSVPIMNDGSGYSEPDDGACEGQAYSDMPCGGMPPVPGIGCVGPRFSQQGLPSTTAHARSPGENGWNYPCGGGDASCKPILYNALLYFRLDDLDAPAQPKDHEPESDDWWNDVAGCDANATDYPCPEGDDDREGNSHPFNPRRPWPAQSYDGRDNHGGSDSCERADGPSVVGCHGTRLIRIAYGYAAHPPQRDFWLVDNVGSDAPYHCHEHLLCGPDEGWVRDG